MIPRIDKIESDSIVKFKEKKLTTTISASTVDIAELRYINLTIGTWYRVSGMVSVNGASAGDALVYFNNNGSRAANIGVSYNGSSAGGSTYIGLNILFKAQATTLTVDAIANSGGTINGGPNKDTTYIQLEELTNYVETTDWD